MNLICITNNWFIYEGKSENGEKEFQVSDYPIGQRTISYDFKFQLSAIDFANNNKPTEEN